MMGGKSVGARDANIKARQKLAKGGVMKNFFEDKASQEKTPPTRDEVICKSCGFKARYKFLRCPECNEIQK